MEVRNSYTEEIKTNFNIKIVRNEGNHDNRF